MSKTIIIKKRNRISAAHIKFLAAIIVFAVICSIPFVIAAVRHSFISGDDILTHMQRVEGMISSYRIGHIPARLHLNTFYGYAYGMGFFYPQLFLLIPLVMRLLGLNFILTTNGFMVLINILTVLCASFCVYSITKSKTGAFTAAIASLFGYYRLANLFYRGSIGETLVFAFTPLLVLGLYDIFHEKKQGICWTVIGLSGILYSHLFSFVFTIILLIIFLLITSFVWIKNKLIVKYLFVSIGISLMLTAAFWMPFGEQYLSSDIIVKTGNSTAPYRSPVPLRTAMRIISYWWRTLPDTLFDPLLLVYPFTLISLLFGKKTYWKTIVILLVTGTAGFYFSSDLFPWENFEAVHQTIQFPWRFLFLSAAALPLVLGISVGSADPDKAASTQSRKNILQIIEAVIVTTACVFNAIPVLKNVTDEYIQPSPGYRAVQNDIGAGDYLPADADTEMIKNQGRNVFFDEPTTADPVISYNENGLHAGLQYKSSQPFEAEFPFLYYKGWYYQVENDHPQPAEKGTHGLVQCNLPAAENGVVKVFYQKTACQWVGDFLSCLGLILFGVKGLKMRRS